MRTHIIKIVAGIWCIAFILFLVALLLDSQEVKLPFFMNYREWFEYTIKILSKNWRSHLFLGICFITGFIWFFYQSDKEMDWDDLAKRYSFSKKALKNLNIMFDFGQSNFNGTYYNGIHLSSIPEGLILRHPFPFSYLRPALLIPWNEIGSIKIQHNLKAYGQENVFSKIINRIFPKKYAKVNLLSFQNMIVILPWKKNVEINTPKELILG